MRRYTVRSTRASSEVSTRDLVRDAFDTGEPLEVTGHKAGLDVDFSLEVLQSSRQRKSGEVVLLFSGVTKPDGLPYSASAQPDGGEEPLAIEIFVE